MSQPSALEEKKTKEMTLVGAITSGLEVMLREDERVILLGEDIGTNGGVFRATDGLQLEFGEQRVVDTPLAESGIIGTSIGLAMNGFLPVAEMQFQGFIYPAFQQIVSHAVRMRTRTLSRFTVPLVIRAPYGAGIHAPELHSDSMESLFTHIPGLKVVVPSTLCGAVNRKYSPSGTFYGADETYRAYREDVPVEKYIVNIGEASVRQTGEDVTVLAWGNMVRPALEAARDAFEEKGIQSEVIDLRTLDPLDVPTIIASVEKTGRVVVVHEGHQTSGFGAEIIAIINDEALYSLRAPIQRVTGFDVHVPFFSIEQAYIPSAKRIGAAIEHVMNER
ncbi:LOW QUALITY PROTEIN: branched-chain alpha-keto acid dehydrogenase, E1 component, beta subunit [Geomicrobium sp. JCM 19039]|nr:LOW QUALITY PROTEIN: branched-chain alpha-keto acid dehydrogenase, E1 component, beta subunit [Geomicrobium sp. JCM 19039]